MENGFEIVHLPKEDWKGWIVPIGYTTEEYYDVEMEERPQGFSVSIGKKRFSAPREISPASGQKEFPLGAQNDQQYRHNPDSGNRW